MGLFDDTQYETVNFQIDVVTKKDQLHTLTITDEALGTMASNSNSDRMTFDFVPASVTNIQHDGVSYGIVTRVNTDADFTTPASLATDTVEYSASTGNLNFSAGDISGDVGEAITSTYTVALEGKKAAQHIARNIVKEIRANWRTDTTISGLFYPNKISNNPIPIDEDLGLFRQTLEYQFNAYNLGEDI
jgi:hypothetical protein